MRLLGDGASAGAPADSRLVRRATIFQRIAAYPADVLMSLAMYDWDAWRAALGAPFGVLLNCLHLGAPTLAAYLVEHEYFASVPNFNLANISMSLEALAAAIGFINTLRFFKRSRTYWLNDVDPINPPKSKNLKVIEKKSTSSVTENVNENGSSSPPLSPSSNNISNEGAHGKSQGCANPNATRKFSAYGPYRPLPRREPQSFELYIWDPTQFSEFVFCAYSPLQIAAIQLFRNNASVFLFLILVPLTLAKLIQKFKDLQHDRKILFAQHVRKSEARNMLQQQALQNAFAMQSRGDQETRRKSMLSSCGHSDSENDGGARWTSAARKSFEAPLNSFRRHEIPHRQSYCVQPSSPAHNSSYCNRSAALHSRRQLSPSSSVCSSSSSSFVNTRNSCSASRRQNTYNHEYPDRSVYSDSDGSESDNQYTNTRRRRHRY